MSNSIRPVDANELLKESIYCREEDRSNVYAVPVGKIFSAPTLKMANCIDRIALLEAIKAKCCAGCPDGYDRDKCRGRCDAADEIAIVEDASVANLNTEV